MSTPRTQTDAESTPERASTPLRSIARQYRGKLLLTYVLFNIENLLRLAQPLVIGWAIDGLLRPEPVLEGLYWLLGQHLLHLVIGLSRRVYDTRTFTRIYSEITTPLVLEQRAAGETTTKVAARSVLSREYVEFFEQYVPLVIRALYSVVGGLVLLGWYDWRLVPLCCGLILPAWWLNRIYSRQIRTFSRGLHDRMESEVTTIEQADSEEVHKHYDDLAFWRVRMSDAEAINFGLMELCILAVIVGTLIVYCSPGVTAGAVFAVFRYLMLFLMGLDQVPRIVSQLSRLGDIGTRMSRKKRL